MPKSDGYSIIAGHRKGMIWTQTTQGWKQASKKGLRGVVVNDKLEIVPLTDPDTVTMNSVMEFKVFYDGKPLTTEVYATYDGFSSTPNTYSYSTQCNDQGVAKVKITHPGTWMVRVQKKLEQATQDFDTHVMRAVLIFEVK